MEPLTLRLYGDAGVSAAALAALTSYFGTPPGGPEKNDVPEMSPGDHWVASVALDNPAGAGDPWLIVVGAETIFDGVDLRDRISNVLGLAVSGKATAEIRCATCSANEALDCVEIVCPDAAAR